MSDPKLFSLQIPASPTNLLEAVGLIASGIISVVIGVRVLRGALSDRSTPKTNSAKAPGPIDTTAATVTSTKPLGA